MRMTLHSQTTRKRLPDLVVDAEEHLPAIGAAVAAALEKPAAERPAKVAAVAYQSGIDRLGTRLSAFK